MLLLLILYFLYEPLIYLNDTLLSIKKKKKTSIKILFCWFRCRTVETSIDEKSSFPQKKEKCSQGSIYIYIEIETLKNISIGLTDTNPS